MCNNEGREPSSSGSLLEFSFDGEAALDCGELFDPHAVEMVITFGIILQLGSKMNCVTSRENECLIRLPQQSL